MIYAIEFSVVYGKQGRNGVNAMPEFNEQGSPKYAHSREQAMAWVKTNLPFANVEPLDLADGRFIYQTEWQELDRDGVAFLFQFHPEGATHMMKEMLISSVDTIYEDVKREAAVFSLE